MLPQFSAFRINHFDTLSRYSANSYIPSQSHMLAHTSRVWSFLTYFDGYFRPTKSFSRKIDTPMTCVRHHSGIYRSWHRSRSLCDSLEEGRRRIVMDKERWAPWMGFGPSSNIGHELRRNQNRIHCTLRKSGRIKLKITTLSDAHRQLFDGFLKIEGVQIRQHNQQHLGHEQHIESNKCSKGTPQQIMLYYTHHPKT